MDDYESPFVGLDRGVQPIGVYVKLRERSSRLSSCLESVAHHAYVKSWLDREGGRRSAGVILAPRNNLMRSPSVFIGGSFVNRPWSERGERSKIGKQREPRCTINETRRFCTRVEYRTSGEVEWGQVEYSRVVRVVVTRATRYRHGIPSRAQLWFAYRWRVNADYRLLGYVWR